MDWKVFLSTFALLFVAELGDKTQLAVISMTSKHGRQIGRASCRERVLLGV